MSQSFAQQNLYEVSARLGEMVSSDDDTTLENERSVSEVTRMGSALAAIEQVVAQWQETYPRRDGYVITNVKVQEI